MAHKTTLYIGIGGTGCRILSMVKSYFTENSGGYTPAGIKFLALDTDICLLDNLKDDFLLISPDESVLEEQVEYNLENEKGMYESYLDDELPSLDTNVGSAAIPEHARLMMEIVSSTVVARVRVLLDKLKNDARSNFADGIDVRFVASLAGGTGSRGIISLAMLLSQYSNISLYGYGLLHNIISHYSPYIPPWFAEKLLTNAYSAILELDYMQHASVDNPIEMRIDNTTYHISHPLFREFYMMDAQNDASETITDQQDILMSVARAMYVSSFMSENMKFDDSFTGAFDVKDKKGWIGSLGTCEIVYDAESISELYSCKLVLKAMSDMLKESGGQDDLDSFTDLLRYTSAECFSAYINEMNNIGEPQLFVSEYTRDINKLSKSVTAYLQQGHTEPNVYIKNHIIHSVSTHIYSIGDNFSRVGNFVKALKEQCENLRSDYYKRIEDCDEIISTSEKRLHDYISECRRGLQNIFPSKSRLDGRLNYISTSASEIKKVQQERLMYEHAIDYLDSVRQLATKVEKECVKGRGIISIMMEKLEKHVSIVMNKLQSSKGGFVYDISYRYWGPVINAAIESTYEPMKIFDMRTELTLSSKDAESPLNSVLLYWTRTFPGICKCRSMGITEIIESMPEEQFIDMVKFIHTSTVRMLKLNNRNCSVNGIPAIDAMRRYYSVIAYGDNHTNRRLFEYMHSTNKSEVTWNFTSNECMRNKVIIALQEGCIVPYCLDAFPPELLPDTPFNIEPGKPKPESDPDVNEHETVPTTTHISPYDSIHLGRQKIFIAGSKELKAQRMLLREELNKIENLLDIDIRSLTFEDFKTSLTGETGGRQTNYNDFIRDDADVVIFIFDSRAGSITEEEFTVAYESLQKNRRPDIFVYGRNMDVDDKRLQSIKNKVFDYNKEYYIEYENIENLRYLFYNDMIKYFLNRLYLQPHLS